MSIVIPTAGNGRLLSNVQADTSATRTFPNLSSLTAPAGDLIVAICIVYNGTATDANFSGWTGSFTEFDDEGASAAVSFGVAYKFSSGSESGTIAVTQAGTITGHAAMFLLSLSGAHDSQVPEASAHAATADPATITASWGAEENLFVAVCGNGESATTGSFLGITVAPTNYTDYADTGISADVVGGIEGAVAFRLLDAATEDPGLFTVDTSNTRSGALTLAVRPAPVLSLPGLLKVRSSLSAVKHAGVW